MNLKKWLLKLIPMNKKLILFESVDMGDNAKALYNEMQLQGLLSKYRTVWVVRDKKKHQALFPSVKFITQKDLSYQLFYKFMAKIPIKNPIILPIAVILPLYNLFDSGINSP